METTRCEALRKQLQCDAEKAKAVAPTEQMQNWIEPQKWSLYTSPAGEMLYHSFSDEDLLDILRREAAELGRIPAQHEVFCVYRDYIRRRFGNWIQALRAAGLKEVKPSRVMYSKKER